MIQISLHIGGKAPKGIYLELMEKYSRRLQNHMKFEIHTYKTPQKQVQAYEEVRERAWILDAQGVLYSSEIFTNWLFRTLETQGLRLPLFIGADFGFDEKISQDAKSRKRMISLSPMTFPHEFVPILLLEQIYRADSIQRASPYHK